MKKIIALSFIVASAIANATQAPSLNHYYHFPIWQWDQYRIDAVRHPLRHAFDSFSDDLTIVPKNTDLVTYLPQSFRAADGTKLNGHIAVPAGKSGPFPAVLLLMGSGPGSRYEDAPGSVTADGKPTLLFKGIEDQIISKGIAVFTYDKRGVTPTDDSFLETTIDEQIYNKTADANNLSSDAVNAFDFLSSLPQIDPTNIGVLGHSEGTALAMKLIAKRPQARALFMLGIWTRPFSQIGIYQGVTNMVRIFNLIDINNDGYVALDEYQPFANESPSAFGSWSDFEEDGKQISGTASTMDLTQDGKISEQEWRYFFEQQNRQFEKLINDYSLPWPMRTPRNWFLQYNDDGNFLPLHLPNCLKMHVYQGEIDIQTPFEDALELRDQCKTLSSPLASFHHYQGLGHGFSPRIGLRGWGDTIGPLAPQVALDIANDAAKTLTK